MKALSFHMIGLTLAKLKHFDFATGGECWESYWVTAIVSADTTWHP